MKEFVFHWLDGKEETVFGATISDAFMMAGYVGGAIAALDYYEEKSKN